MLDPLYLSAAHQPSELAHGYGPAVHLLANPYLQTLLARFCAPATRQPELNRLLVTCYRGLLDQVLCSEFPLRDHTGDTRMIASTPQGRFQGRLLDPNTPVVTVNIARAGTYPSHVCFEMLHEVLDPDVVRQDHLVMNRITDALGHVTGAGLHGSKIGGRVEGRYLLFPDPMGATGSSLVAAIRHYQEIAAGEPRRIIGLHLIITPEFIRAVHAVLPDVRIYALRLDRGLSPPEVLATAPGTHWDRERGLDGHQYIVPGGGGIGELLNNAEESL